MISITSPLVGTIISVADLGANLAEGAPVAVIESMKMEHVVPAPEAGVVQSVLVAPGDAVAAGAALAKFKPGVAAEPVEEAAEESSERADLAEVVHRHYVGTDVARPEAVAKRHARGHRTARENITDLIDEGSFIEYGPLAIAAQRRRREVAELIERTPADGMVGGFATVNADIFGAESTEVVVSSYDYMVLAGTQGTINHQKKDRLFQLAERRGLPVIFYTEGGGGRPGDTDAFGVSGLDCLAFALFGRLAGRVPMIGVNSGYCFAGNAALLGTCDVVIATEDSNIGMGGPAMISGGGLGTFAPTEVGPADVHTTNGVVDVLVADEAEATAVAKKLIGFTQGSTPTWTAPPADGLREVVPANRKRVYDMQDAIAGLVDVDSSIEMRPEWNPGLITSLARVEGLPLGIIANNPLHLSGAIDHGAAQKASQFMRFCEQWKLPILFLCDTPGFMVGPESDAEGLPRSAGEMFRVGGNLTVPFGTVVTRKGYGLGAQSMTGGGFKEPLFVVSWPTGEFGPMGLEGAAELGYSRELAEAEAAGNREELFETLVNKMYQAGKATNVASYFEIDDVIDPVDTRGWVSRLLR
jgi:acetyl-CoA carboxylase carboxyltransferase component